MRTMLLWLALLLSPAAFAETIAQMLAKSEATMLVTGSIDLAPDGAVIAATVDQADRISPDVNALIQRASAKWRFAAGSGEDAHVRREPMVLRIVSRREEDGQKTMHIASASFGDNATNSQIRPKKYGATEYPSFAQRRGIQGTVYMLLRVDADGKVTDASATQVNLDTVTHEGLQEQIRGLFAKAAATSAKHWEFVVNGKGNKPDGAWLVRVPVTFGLVGFNKQDYGTAGAWKVYVPGPNEDAPWLDKYGYEHPQANNDALPDGRMQLAGRQLALLTPLDPG